MIHIKQDLTQLVKPSQGQVRPNFWYLGHYGSFGESGPKHPRSWLGNTNSNSKSLAQYFMSNKAILKCQGHLRVKLYLFERVLGPLVTIWGNRIKNRNHTQGNMINNSKSSTPRFTSKDALLNCKGHARVQLCLI